MKILIYKQELMECIFLIAEESANKRDFRELPTLKKKKRASLCHEN